MSLDIAWFQTPSEGFKLLAVGDMANMLKILQSPNTYCDVVDWGNEHLVWYRQQTITWTNCYQVSWRQMALLGHNQ